MRQVNPVELLFDQAHIGTLLNKKLNSSLSAYGLSFTDYTIMSKLSRSQSRSMSRVQLANAIGLTASGITRILAPMDKNNLIQKEANPRDARQSLVTLSATGEQLLTDASIAVEHTCQAIYALLDDDDVTCLAGLLNKIKC